MTRLCQNYCLISYIANRLGTRSSYYDLLLEILPILLILLYFHLNKRYYYIIITCPLSVAYIMACQFKSVNNKNIKSQLRSSVSFVIQKLRWQDYHSEVYLKLSLFINACFYDAARKCCQMYSILEQIVRSNLFTHAFIVLN